MRSVSTFVASESYGKQPIKTHSTLFKSFGALLTFMLLATGYSSLGLAAVIEGTPGVPSCIVDQPGYSAATVNCTANDLGLSSPLVTVIKACNFPGDFATLEVITDITVTSKTRYDIGFWISIDGDPNNDGSESGVCTVINLDNSIVDTDGNSIDLDSNSCGDVNNTGNAVDIMQANLGTFSLPCIDDDGDGFIDVPVIVAYKNSTGSCGGPLEAYPPNKSKCQEDLSQRFDVPVPARIIVNKDTIPDDSQLFDFNLSGPAIAPLPGGGFDGDEDFQLADSDQFDSAIYTGGLAAGAGYSVTESTNASYISTGSCSSDVDGTNTDPSSLTLRAGETVTCDFTNTLNTGSFTVNKDFSDDSTDSVVMTLSCTDGTITTNDLPATEAAPAIFEVTGAEPGATCTATEAATPGYTQDMSDCQAEGRSADGGACTMVNTLDFVPPEIPEPIAVPTLDWRGLLVLFMMMLATGWYFRPAVVRKF